MGGVLGTAHTAGVVEDAVSLAVSTPAGAAHRALDPTVPGDALPMIPPGPSIDGAAADEADG